MAEKCIASAIVRMQWRVTVLVYVNSAGPLHMPGGVTRRSTGRAQRGGFGRLLIKPLEQGFYIFRSNTPSSGGCSSALALEAMQYVHRIDSDFIDHIAAFHHKEGGATYTRYQLADPDEILAFQQEVTDRVVLEGVDPQ